MNTPKLHHYVPQFHLRRFADRKGRLWVWDKRNDRVFASAPGGIAAETQFYRLTQYEADGHDPLMLEKQLSALEGDVAKITEQWLEWLPSMAPLDVVPIPRTNRQIVALFLAVQFMRTLDTREILAAVAKSRRGVALTMQEQRELHTYYMWDPTRAGQLARRLRRSVWIFAPNNTSTPFITSDTPIAFRTGDHRQWLRMGIFSRGTYLVYPMSPRVVLYCYPRHGKFRALRNYSDSVSPVVLDNGMVESENTGQVFMASRFLVSSQARFDSERAFLRTIGTDVYAPPPVVRPSHSS